MRKKDSSWNRTEKGFSVIFLEIFPISTMNDAAICFFQLYYLGKHNASGPEIGIVDVKFPHVWGEERYCFLQEVCQMLDVSPLIFEVRFNSKFPDVGRGHTGFVCKKCRQFEGIIWMSHLQLVWCFLPWSETRSASCVWGASPGWGALLCFSLSHSVNPTLSFQSFAIYEQVAHLKLMSVSLSKMPGALPGSTHECNDIPVGCKI